MKKPQGERREAGTPPASVMAWMLAPAGLYFIAFGLIIGLSGELAGRRGVRMQLGVVGGWIVGGLFLVLGTLICLSPLYYWLRRKMGGGADAGAAESVAWPTMDAGKEEAVGTAAPGHAGNASLVGWKRWAAFGCLGATAVLLVLLVWGIQSSQARIAGGAFGGMMVMSAFLSLMTGKLGRRGPSRREMPIVYWLGIGLYGMMAALTLVFALSPPFFDAFMDCLTPILVGGITWPSATALARG